MQQAVTRELARYKPRDLGWGPVRIARAWDVLMKRLGYPRYVAQGGDWGAIVTDLVGVQAPAGLLGIHTRRDRVASFLAPVPPDAPRRPHCKELS